MNNLTGKVYFVEQSINNGTAEWDLKEQNPTVWEWIKDYKLVLHTQDLNKYCNILMDSLINTIQSS